VTTPVRENVAVPAGRDAIGRHVPMLLVPGLLAMVGAMSPLQVAAMIPALRPEILHALADELAALTVAS